MKTGIAAALWLALTAAGWAQEPGPRTPDGHPDFQGVWKNPPGGSPLERGRFGDALVVSKSEAKKLGDAAAAARYNTPAFLAQADLPDTMEAAVVRGEYRTRLIIDPPDGKLPYSPEAQKAVDAYFATYSRSRLGLLVDNPEERDLSERCITTEGQPPMPFGNGEFSRQIVQTPDHVVIYTEYATEARIIRMGGAFQAAGARSWYGDSIGHWEGDVLVVETRNFRLDMPFHVFVGQKPVMVGPDSRVIEHFTRTPQDELVYSFTVEDPSIYIRPWLAEYAMTRSPNRIFEVACHEGNSAIRNALLGGRMSEKPANEPAKRKRIKR
jgi:hypothetical protein